MPLQFSRQDASRCDKQHRADHGQQERGVERVVCDDQAAGVLVVGVIVLSPV